MCMCVCACASASASACVRACVRACILRASCLHGQRRHPSLLTTSRRRACGFGCIQNRTRPVPNRTLWRGKCAVKRPRQDCIEVFIDAGRYCLRVESVVLVLLWGESAVVCCRSGRRQSLSELLHLGSQHVSCPLQRLLFRRCSYRARPCHHVNVAARKDGCTWCGVACVSISMMARLLLWCAGAQICGVCAFRKRRVLLTGWPRVATCRAVPCKCGGGWGWG